MTGWLRRAGRGRLRDGATLAWSVAEGSRGRRWRAQRLEHGTLIESVLLELDAEGRPTRLEVDSVDGLLTLHPEPGWHAAHGNVVGHDGVRSLSFDWSENAVFIVENVPVGEFAALEPLGLQLGVRERQSLPILDVDRHLLVAPATRSFLRLTETDWRCDDEPISVDGDGTPKLRQGTSWELEAE